MKKEIIYCDLDQVLFDFNKAIVDPHPHLEIDMTNEIWRDFVDDYCEKNPRIFLNLELIDGARNAVFELDKKYDIYFLSTPMWNIPTSYMDKRIALEKNLGIIAYKKLILTHNKGLCMGKYLIDDRIKNGVENFKGEHIHFGSNKFPNWNSVLNYLL